MTEDFKVHIYPSDCDSVGHVNHAHLLTLLERARWSALERHMSYDEYMRTSLWAVVRKEDDLFLGDCGVVLQPIEDRTELEIGYHILRREWGRGYATESARGALDRGFAMGVAEAYAVVRPENHRSLAVC